MQIHGQPDGRAGVLHLPEPGRRDARQHVAAAPGRHSGIAGGVDGHDAVRGGDDRPGALENHVRAVADREPVRRGDPVPLHVRDRGAQQPRHLARVRRDHQRRLRPAAQTVRVLRADGQGVRVEHERPAAGPVEQRAHDRAAPRGGSQARSGRHHVPRPRQQVVESVPGGHPLLVRQPQGHVFGLGGDHAQARRRRGHRHQAGPRPQGAEPGQPRRAGPAARAGHDRDAPEVALVRLGRPDRHERAQRPGREQPDARAVQLRDDAGRDADVGDDHPPGRFRAQGQGQLRGAQRDGERRPQARSSRAGQVAEQPGRQIDRHHRHARGVDVVRDGGEQAGERPLESGPEQRVHDEGAGTHPPPAPGPAGRVENLPDRDAGLPRPLQVRAGVAGHVLQAPEQDAVDVPAALPEQPGGHPAVAAVVPPAAEDRRRAGPARHVRLDGGDDLLAGTFHEAQRRHAVAVDGAALGFPHLRRRQDAHRAILPRPVRRPPPSAAPGRAGRR